MQRGEARVEQGSRRGAWRRRRAQAGKQLQGGWWHQRGKPVARAAAQFCAVKDALPAMMIPMITPAAAAGRWRVRMAPASLAAVHCMLCEHQHLPSCCLLAAAHTLPRQPRHCATPCHDTQRSLIVRACAPHGWRSPSRNAPNRPSADAKISTTRIFTKRVEFAASDSAADEPTMPTLRPHARLAHPVTEPAPRMA